jgi:hypothetical protein
MWLIKNTLIGAIIFIAIVAILIFIMFSGGRPD